jgi:hypothetical protein
MSAYTVLRFELRNINGKSGNNRTLLKAVTDCFRSFFTGDPQRFYIHCVRCNPRVLLRCPRLLSNRTHSARKCPNASCRLPDDGPLGRPENFPRGATSCLPIIGVSHQPSRGIVSARKAGLASLGGCQPNRERASLRRLAMAHSSFYSSYIHYIA